MHMPWMDALVAQMPPDWQPELEPKNDDERLVEVSPELLAAYRAAMWASGEKQRILDEHQAEHDRLDESVDLGEDYDLVAEAKKCDDAHARADDMSHRGAALGASVLLAIRDAAGLGPGEKIRLRTEGVVVMPERKLQDLFGGLLAGVTVIRL